MKKRKRPPVLDQAEQFIALARKEKCSRLKIGEFEVEFEKAEETPNTHAIGFEVSPTDDDWLAE